MVLSKRKRVFVAGHRGMVGSAIVRRLEADGNVDVVKRSSSELDLTNQSAVRDFFSTQRIDHVYVAAARVGGIHANDTYPGQFIYRNLMIESNVIHQAAQTGIEHLLFLGSSCIYPKHAPQPIVEEALLTGPLEETNEPYALAKIAGIKLCESYNRQYGVDYRSLMPTNLYGPGDNYHPTKSHVIPALIRRFHEAKESGAESTVMWGTGQVRREFLHVDDLAAACVLAMNVPKNVYYSVASPRCSHLNVGSSTDFTVLEIAQMVARVVGYTGRIEHDLSKPDGTPRKLMSSERLASLGWEPRIGLEEGLRGAYEAFLESEALAVAA
ncbi:GDP-L-fucose synthase [Paraburkholderia rhizosphaerae]|uniref:GDP-L-fucose synthase n=1 Tax=Paraburkholderia rhizosphaerae TaxID=480658 RepID=A0A4R8LC77_9BURK|nr:GDP-L-fucose synthase [Paraburkholderia rhizosphaerae]TDY40497.1 GDP-L-fucose synthase [Paraburkholderia rhizosphaerae]